MFTIGNAPMLPAAHGERNHNEASDEDEFGWIRSLCEDNDKVVMVLLRDGKSFLGILKSFDHFGNLLLDRTVERMTHPTVPTEYADLYLGGIVIRGENIVLFGAFDQTAADFCWPALSQVPLATIISAQDLLADQLSQAEFVVRDFNRRKLHLLSNEGSTTTDLASLPTYHTDELVTTTSIQEQEDIDDALLEKRFVDQLLKQTTGTATNVTDSEIATARMVFRRWLTTAGAAFKLLEERRSFSLDANE